uniref:Transposon protein, putative, unclassified n=1 Tax=Oryza sativa subsp. japonica TaxID=39947 RepID=Q10NE4_ORYSJ|nr:transposon protein, putative, unclassified [Oryza sativa Japonica Group]
MKMVSEQQEAFLHLIMRLGYFGITMEVKKALRLGKDLQAFEIETADDARIGPKAAHELASRQVSGSHSLSYSLRDRKNYLRSKRQREMAYGQAGSMLMYFQDKIAENPSFQYALQMDSEEQIANIFWADAKMISDYAHFGDVVSFDTTFGTNNESRPFGVFVGFNHFRETVVFGAALMYDETFDSFKWLFETFLKAHNGKHPKTIYTDQDIAMGKAIEEHFERVVQGKRNTELASEFDSRKKLPRIKMRTPMLLQASKVYTPIIFEAFKGEYERSMAACTKALDGDNEFLVSIGSFEGDLTFEEEYRVVGDPSEQTSICSCGKFNRIGILCGHALKVLDLMNIKSLPAQYILKRWTREARSGIVTDSKGINIIENPMMEASLRYKFLSHRFLTLAQQAASYPECTLLVNNTLDILSKQIEEHLSGCASTSDQSATHKEVMPPNNLLSNARLKKKEEQKTRQKALHVGAATQVAEDSFAMDKEEPGEYMHLISFTQLLTGQINDDLLVDDAF